MRKVMMLFFMLLLAVNNLPAGDAAIDGKKLDLAKKGLMQTLKSDNFGARYSALHVLLKLKSDYPELNLSEFNPILVSMVKNDRASVIRVNANMAYIYINSDELSQRVKVSEREDAVAFFNSLYGELNQNALAFAD
ncbi:MAG: hypothetical protein EHM72_03550 [Calditrichaeota bacterium]|nr:MAG: hypothetical protein EHM72_03550 [Calditrichota bacterium]